MKNAGKRLAALVAGCASVLAIAAPDLTPLTQATTALNDCAAVASGIAAIPVPPDAAKASLKAATNDTITDAKQKLAIDPNQASFAQQMKDGAARLDACGKTVRATTGPVDDYVKGLAGQANMSQEDATAVKAAYDTYEKARENMRTALASLTSDHIRASYMRGPLHAHFLQAAAPSTGSGPRRATQ
jgi:hypothetical protein